MSVITSVADLPWEENDLAIAERVRPPHLLELTQGLSRNVDQRFPHVRASGQAVVRLANDCTVSVLGGLPDLERYGPYVAAVIGPFGHLIANHTKADRGRGHRDHQRGLRAAGRRPRITRLNVCND